MTMKTMSLSVTALLGLLVVGFQNCSPVKVSASNAGFSDKVQTTGEAPVGTDPEGLPPGQTPPGQPPQMPPGQPPQNPPPNADLDPREIRCRGMSHSPTPTAIVYDSRQLTGSAPVSYGALNLFLKSSIEAENISSISSYAGSLKVTASTIGSISSFASNYSEFNAQKIGEIGSFAAAHVEVITHELEDASNFAGDFCVSAQKIENISGLASRLSLFGRSEGGKKATLDHLGEIAGFVSIYDFDIGEISNAAMHAKLVNSHVPKLENAAVDIILQDSVIDEVAHVAGRIVLKGNSKVLKTDNSAVLIHQ